MPGISPLIAAQLSAAAYTPLGKQVPVVTSQGTWIPYTGSLAGTTNFSGQDQSGANQFVTYVNSATSQVVISFKGSDNVSNFTSDFTNSGGSAWEAIAPVANQQLAAIQAVFPGYDIMTDGHSLGGGMAQTMALENNLSGYGQNSLPISGTAISQDMGNNYNAYLNGWVNSGATFNETNNQGDPATLLYSTIEDQSYLDPEPTTLANPYVAAEVSGIIFGGVGGTALAAWGTYESHSINTVVSLLSQPGAPSGDSTSIDTKATSDAAAITNAAETETPTDNPDGTISIADGDGSQADFSLSMVGDSTDSYVENMGAASEVFTYNADGSVEEVYFSGPNGTGTKTETDTEYPDGSSQITTYDPDGSSVTTNYPGPNGSGSPVESAVTVFSAPVYDSSTNTTTTYSARVSVSPIGLIFATQRTDTFVNTFQTIDVTFDGGNLEYPGDAVQVGGEGGAANFYPVVSVSPNKSAPDLMMPIETEYDGAGDFVDVKVPIGATYRGGSVNFSVLASQKVYSPGTAELQVFGVSQDFLNLGTFHVGDEPAPFSLTVANTATGSLTDSIQGGGIMVGPFSSSVLSGVQGRGTGTISVDLATNMSGAFTAGQSLFNFVSHDPDLPNETAYNNSFGISAAIQNYATPYIVGTKVGTGSETFVNSGSAWTVNFGTVAQYSDTGEEYIISIGNSAPTQFSDWINGAVATSGDQFSAVYGNIYELDAGASLTLADLSPNTLHLGINTETVTVNLSGANGSGYSGALSEQTIVIKDDVVMARTLFWTGASDTNFANPLNWVDTASGLSATAAPDAADTVEFNSSGGAVTGTGTVAILEVGSIGAGVLELSGGASITAGALDAGVAAGSVAQIGLTGAGTELDITGAATVADDGTGVLSVLSGATFAASSLTIGSQSDSSGALIISGQGSLINLSGALNVGTALGTGDLTVGPSATVLASVVNLQGQAVLEGGLLDPTDNAPAQVMCFAAGTRLQTRDGMKKVEDMALGDLTITRGGRCAPVIWSGRRTVNCRAHPKPETVWPVRVQAGAFGRGLPRRALFLSPDHAVFVGDALIPIKYLINGTTIAQVPMDKVTYYHVQLPHHDLLLAEGLPVESYLDSGDRSNFDNGDGVIRLFPDFSTRSPNACLLWETQSCAPLIVTGPRLAAARACVNALAGGMIVGSDGESAKAA